MFSHCLFHVATCVYCLLQGATCGHCLFQGVACASFKGHLWSLPRCGHISSCDHCLLQGATCGHCLLHGTPYVVSVSLIGTQSCTHCLFHGPPVVTAPPWRHMWVLAHCCLTENTWYDLVFAHHGLSVKKHVLPQSLPIRRCVSLILLRKTLMNFLLEACAVYRFFADDARCAEVCPTGRNGSEPHLSAWVPPGDGRSNDGPLSDSREQWWRHQLAPHHSIR